MVNDSTTTYPCPNCQGQYRVWRDVITRDGLCIRSDAHAIVGSPVQALVCTDCGYIQLFVDPQDFNKQQ
jgi:predicted RNA-binding Zn-ribbon protein involved in translation (DUF1610 family)